MFARHRLLLTALLALSVGASGCGDGAGAGAGSATGTSPAVAPTSSTPATLSDADPMSGQLLITATDDKMTPAAVNVKQGQLKLTFSNAGSKPHELVMLKTDAPVDALPVKRRRVHEADRVVKIGPIPPGLSIRKTLNLRPGKYVFLCNRRGHYERGMRGQLVAD